MKKKYSLSLIALCFPYLLYSQVGISGKITAAQDKTPLLGVTIYFPDLKTGTVSNQKGEFKIENLPQGNFALAIKLLGYQSVLSSIQLRKDTVLNFELTEGVIESKEFVFTGMSQATERSKNPAPVTLVSKSALIESSSSNIIDALSKQPGVSQISSGPSISKPIIRGLGYNRIVVVNDGIRQEGQQWGDEHGIEIDEYSVNSVEILKGPASLSYGSDALAGVINFISAPIAAVGETAGTLQTNFQTNNSLLGFSGSLGGNRNGWVWNARYSNKEASNYSNKYDGKVFNSGFNESNFSGMAGKQSSWGYSHLNFSYYSLNTGISEGERDSITGKFLTQYAVNDSTIGSKIANDKELKGFDLNAPKQFIQHGKLVLNNNFILGNGRLLSTLGLQQNRRKEFTNVLNPNAFGLYFLLNTFNYDVRYVLNEKKNWNVSVGINGMHQESKNKGTEFLIPSYNLTDIGAFVIGKKSIRDIAIVGGFRIDQRQQHTNALFIDTLGNATSNTHNSVQEKFKNLDLNFDGISGSLGASIPLNEILLTKINLSRGFRAPNISELASNGEHEGTLRYEIGNAFLKPEKSWQIDLETALNSEHISAEINLFQNRIKNYIFLSKLSGKDQKDSLTEGLSSYQYKSGEAELIGGEIVIDIHPHPFDWLHFENTFSLVRGKQLKVLDSLKNLPFMPATKLLSEIRANGKSLGLFLKNTFAKIEMEHYFAQNYIYAAAQTETATEAYTLINAGIGGDLVNKNNRSIATICIVATNIFDVAYQNHLSRLKYAPQNYATGNTGIFNMGRNISFKVIVPISWHS